MTKGSLSVRIVTKSTTPIKLLATRWRLKQKTNHHHSYSFQKREKKLMKTTNPTKHHAQSGTSYWIVIAEHYYQSQTTTRFGWFLFYRSESVALNSKADASSYKYHKSGEKKAIYIQLFVANAYIARLSCIITPLLLDDIDTCCSHCRRLSWYLATEPGIHHRAAIWEELSKR